MISLSRPLEKAHENSGFPLRAFVWSLGLHALLLGAWLGALPLERSGVAPVEPLQASFRAQPEAFVVAEAAPSPARPTQPRLVPKPVLAAPDAVLPAPTFNEPVRQASAEASSVGGVPSAPVETKRVAVALADSRESRGPDAAGLRQYRLALAGEAKRFRTYPEAARRDGLAGTAEIRVEVQAGARHAELARSSGHALLDTAALDMLRSAAARAPLPDSLRGQQFAVLLPVVFEVEE